ncbi:L-fucose:H+ symporter permease [Cutibacterium sp.]|uniref:L-fucose:H+ symporter permease n=1 Tax=Cutibacterium sp. TaxID=1912221 RepID=UPI0026DD3754|nr:L-fucose:H+ symporter permease [Cutibacterium sp.]MDO4411516.1 L-fucose:H+ symporter permease [Cutibacterium sp.]
MLIPFILLVCCFAAWGMSTDLTAPLVKVFKSIFSMTNLESSLVQFAYYLAYFCLAIPAALINSRIGYKGGVLIGLSLAACGALLFIPASKMMTYGAFLAALFVLAGGLSILETSANPFVMVMGPEDTATRRLNFAQAFNPIGSNLGVLIATLFILPRVHPLSAAERDSMGQQEMLAMQSDQLQAVMWPYVGLGILYIVLALGISRIKLTGRDEGVIQSGRKDRLLRLLGNKKYSFGVVAQFFNIAAQTCIWTYTLHYVTEALGVSDKVAGYWLQTSLIIFLIMRFAMVALMGRFDARKLMVTMCLIGVFLVIFAMTSVNIAGAVAIVLLSGCISLLFPTIYGEALKGLGPDTKFGAAGLVMAIIGGALMPPVQAWVLDHTSASFSYVVVAFCFAIVASYGWYTLRHEHQAISAHCSSLQ